MSAVNFKKIVRHLITFICLRRKLLQIFQPRRIINQEMRTKHKNQKVEIPTLIHSLNLVYQCTTGAESQPSHCCINNYFVLLNALIFCKVLEKWSCQWELYICPIEWKNHLFLGSVNWESDQMHNILFFNSFYVK